MFVLGITGPSGSGKSVFCSLLEKKGFFHIDTDRLAAEGIEAEVIKLNRISPLDGDTLCEMMGCRRVLLVLEDSFGSGCIGQQVAAVLAQRKQAPERLILKNLEKRYAPEGSVAELERHFSLDAAAVADAVREAVRHGK